MRPLRIADLPSVVYHAVAATAAAVLQARPAEVAGEGEQAAVAVVVAAAEVAPPAVRVWGLLPYHHQR